MDKRTIVWTIIAVGVMGLLVVISITRQDSDDVESAEGLQESMTETNVPDRLPPEILEKLSVPTEIVPVNETVRVTMKTTQGDIVMDLFGADAPRTVGNFLKLARLDFYDGLTFHRVISGFMIQGGDPLSVSESFRTRHGTGGLTYMFDDEINDRLIVRGSVAMTNGGPNTNGSQFFIVTAESVPHLDGKHTNFGQVVSGMDVVQAISLVERDARDNPLERVEIIDVVVQ